MYVKINNPKLKTFLKVGRVIGRSENYYNADRTIPVVVVQMLEYPYTVIRITEKNLEFLGGR